MSRRSLSDINSLEGRNGKGPPAADLLACFPPRPRRLSLMPKPIESSPPRRHQKKSRKGGGGTKGHGSPLMWAKTKTYNSDVSEPTSPKVTCVGQIKVRPKPSSCKNWKSVVAEIERLHNDRKQKKRSPLIEALGFKKDVTQFLTCLRNIRFDFRCFGAFPTVEASSDDEKYGDDDREDDDEESKAVFAKLLMILGEEDQGKEGISKGETIRPCSADGGNDQGTSVPPPNALLLMRCRSAPAKSWQEDREEEQEERKKRLVVMTCGEEFSKLSEDVAQETWVNGEGIKHIIARSRSSKR